jgi:hypothetical protein
MCYCFRGGTAGEGAAAGAPPPGALPEAEAEVLQTTSRGAMSEEDFLGLVGGGVQLLNAMPSLPLSLACESAW